MPLFYKLYFIKQAFLKEAIKRCIRNKRSEKDDGRTDATIVMQASWAVKPLDFFLFLLFFQKNIVYLQIQ